MASLFGFDIRDGEEADSTSGMLDKLFLTQEFGLGQEVSGLMGEARCTSI